MNPIIFLRTAWMIEYKGVTSSDIPNGAGSYVSEHHDGGEVVNFLSVDSKYYGYARIRKGHDLRIQRLGAEMDDHYIDGVTIVFFATNPNVGGQYVVGWYMNARLYRSIQHLNNHKRRGHNDYLAVADKKDGYLVPVHLRKFSIPDDGPGQTNAWYVSEYDKADLYLRKFLNFIQSPETYNGGKKKSGRGGRGWELDAEKRKKIEVAAMDATAEYFELKGFLVKYVHNAKKGWDMEVQKGKTKLLLEVKGTSLSLDSVLLTPNEYLNSFQTANYRVCILENALNSQRSMLHVCKLDYKKRYWVSETGYRLKIIEIKSAALQKLDN